MRINDLNIVIGRLTDGITVYVPSYFFLSFLSFSFRLSSFTNSLVYKYLRCVFHSSSSSILVLLLGQTHSFINIYIMWLSIFVLQFSAFLPWPTDSFINIYILWLSFFVLVFCLPSLTNWLVYKCLRYLSFIIHSILNRFRSLLKHALSLSLSFRVLQFFFLPVLPIHSFINIYIISLA